ncbi:CDP-alcohol phosphatidyltransferase family protein [Micromonospora sp. DR5-3]|uniref:CDP-alcohol phosphatidyltransferase family protein n=1 Tax=unclassified Micromonospora TaxID=2617518 RepID=UPI0011D9A064|nr:MULTISPECIES: CDP-alcohol phosphatidyltransferase family protein [unclassified Micromonospora]MCW3816518.1 CDP-alcohol phosphatidyltransferase family protein [Micromonospora sp. DR5-3]TYC23089.1 CDP-alcohol phosphatidyltransferase family protein [Micromonospora sp. MP36]
MNFAMTLADPSRPAIADFHRVNRGGGLFSESISQWIGAVFAMVAQRLGLRPTALTLTNLVLGLATSVTVVALAGPVAAGDVPAWAVGLVALVGWQIAYALDCADGQLARVTGQGSSAGARVDVLCDVAAQIALVAALGATAVAQRPATPAWLVAIFAGTWMVNLVTSVMQAGPNAASMVTSSSLPVRLVKLVRDYGAVIFLAGLVLAVAPALTVWLVVAFTIVNGGFLLASIAFSARASLR